MIRAKIAICLMICCSSVYAGTATVPPGTRAYVELTESLIGEKPKKGGNVSVGKIVNARVWRDVECHTGHVQAVVRIWV